MQDEDDLSPAAALGARYRGAPPPVGPWNNVIDGLLGHRSVRAYLPDPVPLGTIETMVAAAQSASSSSNLQLWDVVAVEDPERKSRLARLAGNQAHIREAPLFLVWVVNLARAEAMGAAIGRETDGIHYFETMVAAVVDTALAAQNAVVAAESLGLGTVYIGAVRNHADEMAAALALPRRAFALFGMVVGHPDPARPAAVKPRLPQQVVLHREEFDPHAPLAALAAYDAHLAEFQREQGMAEVGWTRAVTSRLRNAASLGGRDVIRALLHEMGFEMR